MDKILYKDDALEVWPAKIYFMFKFGPCCLQKLWLKINVSQNGIIRNDFSKTLLLVTISPRTQQKINIKQIPSDDDIFCLQKSKIKIK